MVKMSLWDNTTTDSRIAARAIVYPIRQTILDNELELVTRSKEGWQRRAGVAHAQECIIPLNRAKATLHQFFHS